MKSKKYIYIGLDVHKESITACVLERDSVEPLVQKSFGNNIEAIRRFYSRFEDDKLATQTVYEAGCNGYHLQRKLSQWGFDCMIAAPGQIPRMVGNRNKNDQIDAYKLAKLLRSGFLEGIAIPTLEDESTRDLLRQRDSLRRELGSNRKRMTMFLLKYDHRYEDGKNWTLKHRAWLNSIKFANATNQLFYKLLYEHIVDLELKVKRYDEHILEIAQSSKYAARVNRLRCFKGIDYLTALWIVVEVGDFRRFSKATQFMSFLGLVPREISSGEKRSTGRITKTGNGYLRRLFIEAAWHYRFRSLGATSKRWAGQPAKYTTYAHRAHARLSKKYYGLSQRKPNQKAVTSISRELAGFVWGMMTENVA